jgi:hypothetical protein
MAERVVARCQIKKGTSSGRLRFKNVRFGRKDLKITSISF